MKVVIKTLIFVFIICQVCCQYSSYEKLALARMNNDISAFIDHENKLYECKDKYEYFYELVSIQHHSGMAYGYFDARDIVEDSMFQIYKENIHFVYQTYFIYLTKRSDIIIIEIEEDVFKDFIFPHRRLNKIEMDSIKKIFDIAFSINK